MEGHALQTAHVLVPLDIQEDVVRKVGNCIDCLPYLLLKHFLNFTYIFTANCPKECVNGGMCMDGACKCRPGYSGDACEIGMLDINAHYNIEYS